MVAIILSQAETTQTAFLSLVCAGDVHAQVGPCRSPTFLTAVLGCPHSNPTTATDHIITTHAATRASTKKINPQRLQSVTDLQLSALSRLSPALLQLHPRVTMVNIWAMGTLAALAIFATARIVLYGAQTNAKRILLGKQQVSAFLSDSQSQQFRGDHNYDTVLLCRPVWGVRSAILGPMWLCYP